MYTHIGNGRIIKNNNIIGIFAIDTLKPSRENRKILVDIEKLEKQEEDETTKTEIKGKIVNKKQRKEEVKLKNKSVILMESSDAYENRYELSPIAVTTLSKRIEKGIWNERKEIDEK